jgi:hypothetical protein
MNHPSVIIIPLGGMFTIPNIPKWLVYDIVLPTFEDISQLNIQ